MRSREYKKHVLLIGIILLTITILGGCGQGKNTKDMEVPQTPLSKSAFKLDTIVNLTLYDSNDESIIDGAMELIEQYEKVYSRTLESSELYQLNNRSLPKVNKDLLSFELSDELGDLIRQGLYYSDISNGKFDITLEPITSKWDFKSANGKVPAKEELEEAVKKVGYSNVQLEGNTVTLTNSEIKFDLGAIAKGYIADRVKEYLLAKGIKSAMINLGGNVLCVGEKPNGDPFRVGIQKPFADRNEVIATMDIKDKSVVSSGIYERYIMEGDKLYHHILNPSTGYSYENNLISITIISPKSVDGDGLSTSCFSLGLEDGLNLINSLEDVHAIFITDDYNIYYSEGFFDDIPVTILGE